MKINRTKKEMNTLKKNNINEYIEGFPEEIRILLELIRKTIREAAPGAEEAISYGMPAYKLNGPLVYFAGYKNHIGFYPTASGIEAYKEKLSGYKWSKGAVQFPVNKPLPLDLIDEIVKFRVNYNLKMKR
jgi:uncharacterized protein YdhG (YjbR/CyaY superfamily)